MDDMKVRLELSVALSPLYSPVEDSNKLRPNAEVFRKTKDGWIRFKCFEQLGIFEESVSLAILYIARDKEKTAYLSHKPLTELGKEMRKIIDPRDELLKQEVGMITCTSIHEIAGALGWKRPGKTVYERIYKALDRLGSVIVHERNEKEKWEINGQPGFIRYKIRDDGRLAIVITRRLAMVAFGEEGWLYALLSLDERNQLKGDIAKATHKFFVAWIFESSKSKASRPRPIGLDTLATHIWRDWSSYSSSGKATLRQRLKQAIADISNLPKWKAEVTGRGAKAMVTVQRLDEVVIDTEVTAFENVPAMPSEPETTVAGDNPRKPRLIRKVQK